MLLKTLIYLHGFNSSARSEKACLISQWLQKNNSTQAMIIPELSYAPAQAIKQVVSQLDHVESPVFIGSSLGGYYANYLAEKYFTKAVLINPVVHPYRLLTDYLGPQTNPYTQNSYTLTQEHMLELQSIAVEHMSCPSDRMVLLQTGDEVLDYSEAADYYSNSKCYVESGGDHRFQNFERWLPDIQQFLQLI